MDQENSVKTWLAATIFEYSCEKNFSSVIETILRENDLSSNLHVYFSNNQANDGQKVKPVFLLIQILRRLLSSVETFASEMEANCDPWNSDTLTKIVKLLERTYEQCEFISNKKFFLLLSHLKFLDLMHLLRTNAESSVLVQKLNLHFPRWQTSQKESLQKQFCIENPKVLNTAEESCSKCRRLILKISIDASYRSLYMKEQFFTDMKQMIIDSVILLKEVITNLSSNTGLTVIEKLIQNSSNSDCCSSDDLGNQLLLDYLQPEITPECLLKFLNEMGTALEPPSGGFSSCLLPFDTLSECSDVLMESDNESESESCSEESDDEKDKTVLEVNGV